MPARLSPVPVPSYPGAPGPPACVRSDPCPSRPSGAPNAPAGRKRWPVHIFRVRRRWCAHGKWRYCATSGREGCGTGGERYALATFSQRQTLTLNSDTGEPPGPVAAPAGLLPAVAARPVLARIRALDEAPVTTTPWPGGSDTPPRLAGHHCPLGARRAPDADTLALRPIPRDPDRGPIRPRPRVPRRLRRSAASDGRDPDRGIRARDPRPSKPPSPPTEGAP